MADDKIVRVVGLSSAVLFDKAQPLNPINRRISIIVMNKKAEEAALKDGGSVDIDAETGDPTRCAATGCGIRGGGRCLGTSGCDRARIAGIGSKSRSASLLCTKE